MRSDDASPSNGLASLETARSSSSRSGRSGASLEAKCGVRQNDTSLDVLKLKLTNGRWLYRIVSNLLTNATACRPNKSNFSIAA